MKKLMILAVCLFVLLSSRILCADPAMDLTQDIPVHEKTFDNGLIVLVQEYPGSELVSLNITFKTGSANEGRFCGYGLSHLIEHLMIRSTRSHPNEGDVQKIIKTLGGTFNASTSADTVCVYITVPKRNALEALNLINEMAFSPNLDDNAILNEKKVVHKEIILYEDSPDAEVNERLWATAFQVHPYQHPVLGYALSFEAATPDNVRESYKRFTPNIAVLAVAGDIKAQDVFDAIEKQILMMGPPSYEPALLPKEPAQIMPRATQKPFDIDMSRLSIGFHSPGVLDPDMPALDLVAVILGQGQGSRLYEKLVKKEQLVQSVYASNDTLYDAGLFTISSVLNSKNIAQVKNIVAEELLRLQQRPVTPSELKRAQRLLIANYISSRGSLGAIASSLSLERLLTADALFSQKYIQAISRITASQLQAAAKRYLQPERSTASILLPKSESSAAVATKTPDYGQKLPWKSKVLKNGAQIIAVQNTLTPSISMTVLFKGGLLAETPTTSGLSKICAHMLIREQKNNQEIATLLEDRGIRIQSFSDDNSFGIRVNMLKDDLLFTLQTLGEILKKPVFSNDRLQQAKNKSLLDIQAENDNMFSRGFIKLKQTLYQEHPYAYSGNGTIESVSKLTRQDILDFYHRFAAPESMIIAIAGDVAPEKAIHEAEKIFTRLRPPARTAPFAPALVPSLTETKDLTVSVDRQGAFVFYGFPGLRMNDPDVYSFDILQSIMSGHNGRLIHNIRNANNLTYIQNFFSLPSYENGFFGIYAGTSVEKQHEVIKGINEQIKLLTMHGVTDQEISEAKTDLTTRNLINRQDNGFLSSKAAQYLLYGLDFDLFLNYEKNISQVNKTDLQRIVHAYITGKPHVQILLTSESPSAR